jgi:hypothetical protein
MGLPPLGLRLFSSNKSTTRKDSVYNVKVNLKDGNFGVLDTLTTDRLDGSKPCYFVEETERSLLPILHAALVKTSKFSRLGHTLGFNRRWYLG